MKTRVFAVCAVIFLLCGVAYAGINDGLIAHWGFDGDTRDSSINHIDGIGYGTVTYVPGKIGQAIKFDGISTYINTGNSSLFNVNHHSIVAWVNPAIRSSAIDTGIAIVGKVKPHIYESIKFDIRNKDNYIATWFATDGEVNHKVQSSKTISINQWHHVAMTYDGAYVRFFIDGALSDEIPRTGTVRTNTNDLAIGRHGGDADQLGDDEFFSGLIDEVRIYSRALSASEILQLYQGTGTCSSDIVTFIAGTPAKAADVNANFDAHNCQIQALKTAFCLVHPTASICQ